MSILLQFKCEPNETISEPWTNRMNGIKIDYYIDKEYANRLGCSISMCFCTNSCFTFPYRCVFYFLFFSFQNLVRINNWVMKWLFALKWMNVKFVIIIFFLWCVNTHTGWRANKNLNSTRNKILLQCKQKGEPIIRCMRICTCIVNMLEICIQM